MKKLRTLIVLVLLALFCITSAQAAVTTRAGKITAFKLYSDAVQKPGVAVKYKVTVSQKGTAKLYLTDTALNKTELIQSVNVSAAGAILMTIPGTKIQTDKYYTVRVDYYTGSTKVGTASTSITTKAPSISNLTATSSFNPMKGGQLTVSFNLSDDALVTAYVMNSSGKTVASLLSKADKSAGKVTFTWNGFTKDGTLAPEGQYNIRVFCQNGVGKSETLKAYFKVNGTNVVTVGGTCTGVVRSYFVAKSTVTGYKANLYLATTSDSKYTLLIRDKASGKNITMTGTLPKGFNIIPLKSSYFATGKPYLIQVKLQANGAVGTGQLTVCFDEPKLTNVGATSTATANYGKNATVSYRVSAYSKIKVVIKDSAGTIVRTIEDGEKYLGTYYAYWDLHDLHGSFVEPGIYTATVTATNSYGTATASKPITVKAPTTYKNNYGKVYVGVGHYKDRIQLYSDAKGLNNIGYTYAQSAVFTVLKEEGDYYRVRVSKMTDTPITCYVLKTDVYQLTISSPYRIEICIDRTGPGCQMFYLYKNNVLIDSFNVSTGVVEGSTPTGTFVITDRMPWFTNSGVLCEHALRVCGGVCIHRVPYWDNSYVSTTALLGQVASHGCIRVPVDRSLWLYENIPDTTPVYIYYQK